MISIRYDFVSYSQQQRNIPVFPMGCLWLVSDTILSAIHNNLQLVKIAIAVVYD